MAGTALFAGMGPGFCEEFARKLAEDGYGIGMFARSEEYISTFESELEAEGYEAAAVPTDLTDRRAVKDGIEQVRDALGPIDVLAYTASTAPFGPEQLDPQRFDDMWNTHVMGPAYCVRNAIDDLRDGGTVLLFGADAEMGDAAYKSAKSGARALARSMADDFGPQGVHVAFVVIGSRILNPDAYEEGNIDESQFMNPEAVAETCFNLVQQDESAVTFETDLHTTGNRRFYDSPMYGDMKRMMAEEMEEI